MSCHIQRWTGVALSLFGKGFKGGFMGIIFLFYFIGQNLNTVYKKVYFLCCGIKENLLKEKIPP